MLVVFSTLRLDRPRATNLSSILGTSMLFFSQNEDASFNKLSHPLSRINCNRFIGQSYKGHCIYDILVFPLQGL